MEEQVVFEPWIKVNSCKQAISCMDKSCMTLLAHLTPEGVILLLDLVCLTPSAFYTLVYSYVHGQWMRTY